MAIALDTLKYSEKLQEVGFTPEQAKVQVETLLAISKENLATKQDLTHVESKLSQEIINVESKLSQEIINVESKLSQEIINVESKLSQEIINVESKLSQEITNVESRLRQEMKDLELRLTLRLGGMMVVLVGVVATLVKLL